MAATEKKKGKKGLMIGVILLVVFGGTGAVFGLAMTGKINIPGVTPKKKAIPPPVAKKATKPVVPEKEPEAAKDVKSVQSPESVKQGAIKLAEVWNEMPTENLIKVVDKWQPSDLAIVLNEMDPEKVAQVLGAMKPEKASNVSQQLRSVAAQIPSE